MKQKRTTNVEARQATEDDIAVLLELNRAAYPTMAYDNFVWGASHLPRGGFVLKGVMPNYLHDIRSRNYSSLIEWRNPEFKPDLKCERKVPAACVQYKMRKIKIFNRFASQVTYFSEGTVTPRLDRPPSLSRIVHTVGEGSANSQESLPLGDQPILRG